MVRFWRTAQRNGAVCFVFQKKNRFFFFKEMKKIRAVFFCCFLLLLFFEEKNSKKTKEKKTPALLNNWQLTNFCFKEETWNTQVFVSNKNSHNFLFQRRKEKKRNTKVFVSRKRMVRFWRKEKKTTASFLLFQRNTKHKTREQWQLFVSRKRRNTKLTTDKVLFHKEQLTTNN